MSKPKVRTFVAELFGRKRLFFYLRGQALAYATMRSLAKDRVIYVGFTFLDTEKVWYCTESSEIGDVLPSYAVYGDIVEDCPLFGR